MPQINIQALMRGNLRNDELFPSESIEQYVYTGFGQNWDKNKVEVFISSM